MKRNWRNGMVTICLLMLLLLSACGSQAPTQPQNATVAQSQWDVTYAGVGGFTMVETLLIPMNDPLGSSLRTWLPLLVPLALLELVLVIVALIDLIRRDPRQVRGSKLAWGLIILLISTLGPICYLLLGRKEQADVDP